MVQTVSSILQVDPVKGLERVTNPRAEAFKSLTAALQQVSGSTLIRLAVGTYSSDNGERFPLVIPAGTLLSGDENNGGRGVILRGGGSFRGSQLGDRNFTMVLQGDAQVRGVTLVNPQGSGLGLEAGRSLLRASQITQCSQDGVVVAGGALLNVLDCQIDAVGQSGIVFSQRARGEVQRCGLRRCDCGIAVKDEAAPLISDSQCSSNRIGISLTQAARPVLRRTQIVQNQATGLWLQQTAWADLGQPQDPGGNTLRYNAQNDLRNDSSRPVLCVGNDVLPQRITGAITLGASQLPDPAAVPLALIDSAPVTPGPAVPPAGPGVSPPPPPSGPTRFSDLTGQWATPYIEGLAQRGLIRGLDDGTFQPDRAVTRAEFAALVVASFPNVPAAKPTTQFVDVPAGFWAQDAIAKAQRQGFLSGYPDQSFRPNEPISRVHGIVAIANGLGLAAAPASTLGIYRDRAQIPSYAAAAVAAATQNRLLVNPAEADQLRPLATLSRAEAASLVYQGLVYQGKVPVIDRVSTAQLTTSSSFSDLAGHWSQPFVEALAQRQLISGLETGQFQPDQAMTRAQYAALLMRTFQPQPRRPATSFVDVPPNFWAAEAIQAVYRGGFLSGFPDHTFAPDHPLLRVQVWLSLVNGLALQPGRPGDQRQLNGFSDRQNIPAYALDSIAKAAQLGLIINAPEPTRLRPNQVASRADIVATLYQTLVLQQRFPAITSPYQVKPSGDQATVTSD